MNDKVNIDITAQDSTCWSSGQLRQEKPKAPRGHLQCYQCDDPRVSFITWHVCNCRKASQEDRGGSVEDLPVEKKESRSHLFSLEILRRVELVEDAVNSVDNYSTSQ